VDGLPCAGTLRVEQHRGVRHLRAFGDHRPAWAASAAVIRAAHLRGPLLSGDRRSCHRRARWPTATRRAGADHPEQAGDAHGPLSHTRHHHDPAGQCDAAHTATDRRIAGAATTCHHSRRQCISIAGGGRAAGDRGHPAHYQIVLTREQGLDEMEVQVEVTPRMFTDKIGRFRAARQLQGALDHVLGIRCGCAGGGEYHRAKPGQGKTRHRQETS